MQEHSFRGRTGNSENLRRLTEEARRRVEEQERMLGPRDAGILRRFFLWCSGAIGLAAPLALESCRHGSSAPSGGPAGTAEKAPGERPSIGTATMNPDRSIVLTLRATGPNGMIGDGRLVYSPSDPKYQDVLRHIGGLQPGETKPVPPWPDEDGKPEKIPATGGEPVRPAPPKPNPSPEPRPPAPVYGGPPAPPGRPNR